MWPSRRGQPRTCRGQAQVLQNRAPPRAPFTYANTLKPASTPHAGEHIEVERPAEQLGGSPLAASPASSAPFWPLPPSPHSPPPHLLGEHRRHMRPLHLSTDLPSWNDGGQAIDAARRLLMKFLTTSEIRAARSLRNCNRFPCCKAAHAS